MKTLSLRIPERLAAELAAAAELRGISKSSLVREALGDLLAREDLPARGSALAAIEDLVGCVEGPEDLSVNPEYLEDLGG